MDTHYNTPAMSDQQSTLRNPLAWGLPWQVISRDDAAAIVPQDTAVKTMLVLPYQNDNWTLGIDDRKIRDDLRVLMWIQAVVTGALADLVLGQPRPLTALGGRIVAPGPDLHDGPWFLDLAHQLCHDSTTGPHPFGLFVASDVPGDDPVDHHMMVLCAAAPALRTRWLAAAATGALSSVVIGDLAVLASQAPSYRRNLVVPTPAAMRSAAHG